jgi:hypothetical protein
MMPMKYYGLLSLVLACLMASVFVEGKNLFGSSFFAVAYAVMAFVLAIGSKHPESLSTDIVLGMLLIFAVGFLSTQALIEMATNNVSGMFIFKIAIIVSLDYAALSFLKLGMKIKQAQSIRGDGRYAIERP